MCAYVGTSPQPLAEVTLRTVMLMLPPPFPLCVEREPDSTAVSELVRGAWREKEEMSDKTENSPGILTQVRSLAGG